MGQVTQFKPEGKALAVRGVTFCEDYFGGNVMVTSGEDKLVRLWDIRNPSKCVREMKGHQGAVNGVKFAYDSATGAGKLYTIGADKAVKMWYMDGSDGKVFDSFFGHTGPVVSIDCIGLDRPVTGGDDGAVRSWNLSRDSHTLFASGGHSAPVDSVFLLDAGHYLSGGQDGSLCLWGATNRKALAREEDAHGEGHWVTAVSGIRHSDVGISGSHDGRIKFWRVGRPAAEMEGISKKVKMVIDPLHVDIPVTGIVNEIVTSRDGKLMIGAVGRDHKHGRWITEPTGHNGLLFSRLNY
jgi:ribosomal RNA-processing protein 9